MSATNVTTHYNLPIFVGTDKPAWLVDFNGAMNAIDSAIYNAAQAAAGKENVLSFDDSAEIDFTRTGDRVSASLSAAASDQLGRAILKPTLAPTKTIVFGEDDNGVQKNLEVGSGLSVADDKLSAVDLNLSDTGTATLNIPSGITNVGNNISYALNADGTIGKLYGYISLSGMTVGQTYTITITNKKVAASGADFTIATSGIGVHGNMQSIHTHSIQVGADGTISLRITGYSAGNCVVYFLPCLYLFKDFGDE